MPGYVDNILEMKIALVSLAIIMVLTGVTFGIGFAFQKRPQLLKGKYETMLAYSSMPDISPRHLAFEKKIPSKTAYHVLPIYEEKKILSKTFLSCPTHFQKW